MTTPEQDTRTLSVRFAALGWRGNVYRRVRKLQENIWRLHKLYERYTSDPTFGPKDERRMNELEKQINDELQTVGLTPTFTADPRGAPVKVPELGTDWPYRDFVGTPYIPRREPE